MGKKKSDKTASSESAETTAAATGAGEEAPALAPAGRLPWRAEHSVLGVPPTVHLETTVEPEQVRAGGRVNHWQLREPSDIEQSWRTQSAIVNWDGEQLRLQAQLDLPANGGIAAEQPVVDRWPLDEFIVVASVAGPVASLRSEVLARRNLLRSEWHHYHVPSIPGSVIDRQSRWAEPAIITFRGDDPYNDWDERVFERCRQLTLNRIVRVIDGRWEVLDLSDGEVRVASSDACTITRDTVRRCPMLDRPDEGEYCHMVGGPWVSRSINAALAWTRLWGTLNASVGCDTCAGVRYQFQNKIVQGGGVVAVTQLDPLPTRWLEPVSV